MPVAIPRPGAVVTYFDGHADPARPFGRGVVNGYSVRDPGTAELWVPVVCDGRRPALVDAALIVNVVPPTAVVPDTTHQALDVTDLVCVLRTQVRRAVDDLVELDYESAGAQDQARRLLASLFASIAPTRKALLDRPDDELDDALKVALSQLDNAAMYLRRGDIPASRVALIIAHSAIDTVPLAQPDEAAQDGDP